MAINDVLPLKAARRDAIANFNLESFWGLGHQRPIFDGYIYIQYAAPPYSARISAIFPPVWQRLVGFGFRVQRVESTMQNLRMVDENSNPILSRLRTKVHKIFRRCRNSLVLSNALFRVSMTSFVQKIFAIKSRSRRKTEQIRNFLPPIFVGGTAPTFLRQFVRATYYQLLGKVWLSSVC